MTKVFRGAHVTHHCNLCPIRSQVLHNFQAIRRQPGHSHYRTATTLSSKLQTAGNKDSNDDVNPPISSLPPPLELPDRAANSSTLGHLYRTGRAYGSFYWKGLKAAWSNHKECKPLREGYVQVKKEHKLPGGTSIPELALAMVELRLQQQADIPTQSKGHRKALTTEPATMTRASYQRLIREKQDWLKLPRFALLVMALGEYLPLVVPFFPSISPNTCQIPSQIRRVRETNEDRRRNGVRLYAQAYRTSDVRNYVQNNDKRVREINDSGPPLVQIRRLMGIDIRVSERLFRGLDTPSLYRTSLVFLLHGKIWDRVGIIPPRWLLARRGFAKLQHLMIDDLLLRDSHRGIKGLSQEELMKACEDRAIPVLDQPLSKLERDLAIWQELVFSSGAIYGGHNAVARPWHEWQAIFDEAKRKKLSFAEALRTESHTKAT